MVELILLSHSLEKTENNENVEVLYIWAFELFWNPVKLDLTMMIIIITMSRGMKNDNNDDVNDECFSESMVYICTFVFPCLSHPNGKCIQ